MKVYKIFPSFPIVRRHYKSYEDLAKVIDRSISYVNNRLNGRGSFTRPEKLAILLDIGMSPDQIDEVFPEVIENAG